MDIFHCKVWLPEGMNGINLGDISFLFWVLLVRISPWLDLGCDVHMEHVTTPVQHRCGEGPRFISHQCFLSYSFSDVLREALPGSLGGYNQSQRLSGGRWFCNNIEFVIFAFIFIPFFYYSIYSIPFSLSDVLRWILEKWEANLAMKHPCFTRYMGGR